MQAVEFMSEITKQGELPVPRHLAKNLPPAKKVRVIVLFPSDENEDADWSRLTAEQFLAGYAPGDAVYDQVEMGKTVRGPRNGKGFARFPAESPPTKKKFPDHAARLKKIFGQKRLSRSEILGATQGREK